MDISSGELEVFAAVVDSGSFGRAATALMISQPSISERIARLERPLGAQLFVRTARGVVPTAAGEALVPFAASQTVLIRDAVEAVRSTDQIPALTVAVHSTFTPRVAPLVLDAILSLPRRVEFRDAHSEEVIEMILDSRADAGFIVPTTTPRTISGHRMPPDPICCVVSPEHRLANRTRLGMGDLCGSLVAFNQWGHGADVFADLLAQRHGRPELRRRVADARTAALLAVEHDHVAFVARSAVEIELEHKLLSEVTLVDLPEWTVDLECVHRAGTTDDAVLAIVGRIAGSGRT